MSLSALSLFVDIAMAGLLVAVIVYAVRLNRHMSALQKSKRELEALLSGFTDSTERAEAAVNRIKSEAGANREDLKSLVRDAEQLREDLAFMVERGGAIADKLEAGISRGRSEPAAAANAPAVRQSGKAPGKTSGRAGKEAMGGPAAAMAPPLSAGTGPGPGAAPGGAIAAPAADGKPEDKRKSKSDLLKALQGMR